MDEKRIEILTRRFPEEQIKTRPGGGGKRLRYIEGARVIERLNEAFSCSWSWRILDSRVEGGQVLVCGELVIPAGPGIATRIIKQAYGGADLTIRGNGQPSQLGDDMKSAATDALKKAASMLGVGLELHMSDTASPPPQEPPKWSGRQRRDGGITDRQVTAILAIAKSIGWSNEKTRKYSIEKYNRTPGELSKSEASSLIGELQSLGRCTNET